MKAWLTALLLFVSLAVIQAGAIKDGDPAPELKGEHWSDGGDYTWDRLAGKVVVLSFYTTYG